MTLDKTNPFLPAVAGIEVAGEDGLLTGQVGTLTLIAVGQWLIRAGWLSLFCIIFFVDGGSVLYNMLPDVAFL